MNQKDWWDARFKDDKKIISQGGQVEIAKILTDKLWIKDVKDFEKIIATVGCKVLDLGCGLGQLSCYFEKLGFDVTSSDFSENALAILKSYSPNIKALAHDMTKPLPFSNTSFDIVIANLSLHYFNHKDTRNAICEIKRVLKSSGLLIGSVVSTDEYEVVKHKLKFKEVEPNFYHELFDAGIVKHIRFFDRKDVDDYFAGFEFLHLENKFTQRMGKVKGAWEFIMRKGIK